MRQRCVFISAIILRIRYFQLNKIYVLGSITLIFVPLGCLFSGTLAQPFGRKRAMQLVNLPMFGSWLIFYFARHSWQFYTGLALAGVSGGLLEAPVLTYVAEICEPSFRGMLAATGSTCVIFGILLQFIMGTFLNWRQIAMVDAFVPMMSFIALFFVPESPHWLIKKGKYEQAKESLAWLRGWTTKHEIDAEYTELRDQLIESKERSNGLNFKLYRNRSFLHPFLIITLTFFIGHFSGMTPLQTNAVEIFQTLKAPIDKYYATMLLGVAELSGTILCVILVKFTGKRPLVLLSCIGCGLCLFTTATYAHFYKVESHNSTSASQVQQTVQNQNFAWIPITLLLFSALLSHIGIRLIPWMLIGELFPISVRSIASGLAGGLGYVFSFAANKLFYTMKLHLTLIGTFWIYSSVGLIGALILFFVLPETEARTLMVSDFGVL